MGCMYCIEDHCTIGVEFNNITENNTCKHEDKQSRIFDIVGTGMCTAKDSDLRDFCPDCMKPQDVDEGECCRCNEYE